MKNTSILKKRVTLELLESMLTTLDNEESYINTKTVWYDTDEPRKNEDGSVKTREDGTIVYKQTYRDEPRPASELTDENKVKLEAIEELRKALEKMI